jgi:hypothetical protein
LLVEIISNNFVKETIQTEFGTKYIVEGRVSLQRTAVLKTVWIVLNGENICRFVTPYPL